MQHMIDSLECRRLLSVTLNTGTVRVTGTGGNDVIEFQLREDDGQIRVEFNGSTRRFAIADVQRFVVDAGAGNDFVEFSGRDGGLFLPSYIVGGDGNDTLEGGGGRDTLRGGLGRDHLEGHGGSDWLDGQSGSDFLEGNAGNDRLDGGAANDDIKGNDGSDRITGGSGEDDISGGSGTDAVFGGLGNDDFDNSDSAGEIKDRSVLDDGPNSNP